MNLWKNLLILATAICLVSPVAVSAFDEVPSFSNPAQAQHAENIAEASFSEIDMEDAKERAQTAYAEDMAESFIEEKAQDYAEGVFEQKAEDYAEEFVIQKSENHADGVIEKLADDYVKELLETKAKDHADDVCAGCDEADPNWIAAKEAYLEQTSEESMEQLKTNKLQELDGGNEWNEAYQYAYKRATGDGYRNLKMTT